MATPSKSSTKRPATKSQPTVSISSPPSNVLNGLLACFNFLSPNEYPDKTVGLLAFLTRQSVGEINFSEILDEAAKRSELGQASDFIALLQHKRDALHEIDASIEKCLMINRFISYIQENESRFMTTISHIRLDMRVKMADMQANQTIQYPNDFRQRELDFLRRKTAQDMQRLFYLTHTELKEPANLIHLKNRTTEHLSDILDGKMRYNPTFRDTGLKELLSILNTSFIITAHPHSGVNPVIIYDRKGDGGYTAKVSVTIVSLLHDFMQTHPNLIELYDVEPSLSPSSKYYKLEEPRSIPWKTRQLQVFPGEKPHMIQYAELSFITIQQACKTDARVHFAQALHTLKFSIKLHINLTEYRFSKTHQILLESLPFGIGNHNNQIPKLLTRVILDDIRRFSKVQLPDVRTILNFMQRYFIHRTGVKANEYARNYLNHELNRALNERKNFQSLEDIYMDFLVPYVYQVETMAKHPILAMWYAEGLFLGTCNSEQVADALMQSSDGNSPKVALRFNSIKVEYHTIAMKPILGRTIKIYECAVRVDIYNHHIKRVQYRTFDSSALPNDLSKFVSTPSSEISNRIRILSNFVDKTNNTTYKSFTQFNKYYDGRLHQISKTDEKYKLITDLIDNVKDGNADDVSYPFFDNILPHSSHSIAPISPATSEHEHARNSDNVHDGISIHNGCHSNNEASSRNSLSPSNDQQNQSLIQYILSKPEIAAEIVRQFNMLNLGATTVSVQQQQFCQSHPQIPYQNHPSQVSYMQPTQILNQPQPSSVIFQPPQMQRPFQQHPQQIHFQQQQQQLYTQQLHQQQASRLINPCHPNNVNQSEQFQLCSTNGSNSTDQQHSPQVQILQMSGDILSQSSVNLSELMTTYEIPSTDDQDFTISFDDILDDTSNSEDGQ